MPATHTSLHCHIVFSTKDRHPFIADAWRGRLHEYLGGLIRAAEAVPEAVGGRTDHVHLLVGLRATHSIATLVQDIKQTSSRWIHETIAVKDFSWQPGYGAFTVSVSKLRGGPGLYCESSRSSPDKDFSGGICGLPQET